MKATRGNNEPKSQTKKQKRKPNQVGGCSNRYSRGKKIIHPSCIGGSGPCPLFLSPIVHQFNTLFSATTYLLLPTPPHNTTQSRPYHPSTTHDAPPSPSHPPRHHLIPSPPQRPPPTPPHHPQRQYPLSLLFCLDFADRFVSDRHGERTVRVTVRVGWHENQIQTQTLYTTHLFAVTVVLTVDPTHRSSR